MEYYRGNDKISILMPVRNAMPFLVECLDSILAQTVKDWELIAINNQSEDSSLAILEKYAQLDNRIKVFTNNGDPKIIPALQLAFEKSTGKMITRMDADDIMVEYKLEDLKRTLKKHKKGTVVTGKVNYFSVGELGEGFIKYEKWLNEIAENGAYFNHIYKECVIPSPCWMMYRSDLEKVGGIVTGTLPEDYDLAFRIYKKGLNVVGTHRPIHLWRDHFNRNSRNDPDYADNSFLSLKTNFFLDCDYNEEKELTIWGAGKKGKNVARILLDKGLKFTWITDNKNKIGRDIYGVILQDFDSNLDYKNHQTIILVSNPDQQSEILDFLNEQNLVNTEDYFMFV